MEPAVPLNLTQLDKTPLPRSPLTSVICQVRYDPTPAAADAHAAQRFYEQLGGSDGELPVIGPINEMAFNVALGPQAAPALAQQHGVGGWRFASADDSIAVALTPVQLTLETGMYNGWEADFFPRLERVLSALAELVSPVFEQRLGLRYINNVDEPAVEQPRDWGNWIAPHLLGLAAHQDLGDLVRFVRQQAVLEFDDETRCTFNHGFAPDAARDGHLVYLLDFDVAREGMRPFRLAGVLETATKFNTYALALFQLSITPALREYLLK